VIRVLAFIKRRPDVTREFFRNHYETTHVATALPLLGGVVCYERRHIQEEIHGAPGFDCMSTFGYRDGAAAGAAFARIESPAGDAIRRDEQRFMDKPANFFFPVEDGPLWRAPGARDESARLLVCARRPAAEDAAGFRARFESERLRALRAVLDAPAWCRAHFARADAAPGRGFDVVTELAAAGAGGLADFTRALEATGAAVIAVRVSVHETAMAG
jgi:uncharacterized protein (TIGR02118 family)